MVQEVLQDTASFSTKVPLNHGVATSEATTVYTTATLEHSTSNVFAQNAF